MCVETDIFSLSASHNFTPFFSHRSFFCLCLPPPPRPALPRILVNESANSSRRTGNVFPRSQIPHKHIPLRGTKGLAMPSLSSIRGCGSESCVQRANLHPVMDKTAPTSAWPWEIGGAIKGNDNLNLDLASKLWQTSANTNSNGGIQINLWTAWRI